MILSELIKKMTEHAPMLFEKDIDRAVKELVNTLSQSLVDGNRIEIRGFGSFDLREYQGRVAINPKSGEKVQLGVRRIPSFRLSSKLHKQINKEE